MQSKPTQIHAGPFLVTTTRLVHGAFRSNLVERHAVATLEETRGPVPDGCMVTVKRVGWGVLREALTFPSGLRPHDPDLGAQIIAAYNAKQEAVHA